MDGCRYFIGRRRDSTPFRGTVIAATPRRMVVRGRCHRYSVLLSVEQRAATGEYPLVGSDLSADGLRCVSGVQSRHTDRTAVISLMGMRGVVPTKRKRIMAGRLRGYSDRLGGNGTVPEYTGTPVSLISFA